MSTHPDLVHCFFCTGLCGWVEEKEEEENEEGHEDEEEEEDDKYASKCLL